MARNKEALVLLLDVGPSMHHLLPEVEKICSMIVQKKLVYSKYDEVGVVLFGTEETENELTMEVGGYEHVVVLQNIKVVDGDLVETLKKIPRGTLPGDFLDAIVVGMDMLIKKYSSTNKGKKRLCLITNGLSPIKDPYEGSKEDQVNAIAQQMTSHGMKLESVVVRESVVLDENVSVMEENDRILNLFPKRTCAKMVFVESSTSLLGALKTRSISPVTIFRGDLEISPKLKIKVWVYKKTSEEKFPTLKKYSDKAPSTDKFASHEVKVDFEYKSVEDANKVVPPEQRIKGYQYGPQVVPISADEWDAVKFKPEKSVKVLGFTDSSNIMRHHYMKDVNIFIADPGDQNAILAVSALARAMKEMHKVAILRCVWRQGQGNVVVGALTPNVSDNDHVPDSFYFNVLPFAEDVREFQFPSFSNLPASLLPDEEQQEAADNFVKMLDLAPSDKEEMLQPDFTPNPVLELKKSMKRMREKPSGSDEEDNYRRITSKNKVDLIENGVKVEKIGDLTPVQDFELMMSRRDNPEWINRAITEMKNKIHDLIEDSIEGDNYPKALDLLVALRKGCILEQEPKQFNDFLHQLCKFCLEHDLRSFCDFLASKGITLISKTEAVDSDVTEEEARNYLVKREAKPE
ncbi:ATP-dependent DNA helicase 2 subunit KU80 isoform X3 [Rhodamnia argentea]|uniref:ATP-dependent DNA helicase 2 subunit KU80 n=1 Tax=Rhodamnia argentea TaxID=178133 RepID=A0ABM3H5K8_9MYRT|nr:ATP-dependent DNA helicase 2 subunit KU80 isoform X3 [Rhodamnia argentea]